MAEENCERNGRSFLEALLSKYHHPKDLELDPDIFIPQKAPAKADSSGNIVLKTDILALNRSHIKTIGNLQDIQPCLNALKEVDLTSNLLSDWSEVFKLIACMPMVEFLNLTSNPLSTTIPEECLSLRFPSVKQLVLNSTKVPWSAVRALVQIFPNIVELHLSLNGYITVEISDCVCYSITVLFFNGNELADWSEVCKLGVFCPNLQTLVMGESGKLKSFGDGERCAGAFPNLSYLTVSDIAVQDWEHIDTLRSFPRLDQLKIQRIPLLESGCLNRDKGRMTSTRVVHKDYDEKEGRSLLVARLPNISKLNGSQVTNLEREDAERAFIRYYMESDERPNRFDELEKKYGKLDPLVKVNLTPPVFVNVLVKFGDKQEHFQINLKETVKEFKKSLQNFVGLPITKFRLYYIDCLCQHGAAVIRTSDRKMFSFNIADGDEFVVEPSL